MHAIMLLVPDDDSLFPLFSTRRVLIYDSDATKTTDKLTTN